MRHLVKYGTNPGVPTPKRGEAIAVAVDDVEKWPTLNADGVTWDGNFVFKAGTGFTKIYMTPATQKALLDSEGSADAYGTKGKFEGEYPGTPKEAIIWSKKNNSRGFVIFYGGCDTEEYKTMGTKCLPMILKISMEDNNEKNFLKLNFEQEMINDQYIRFYSGTVDFDAADKVVAGAAVNLAAADGTTVYRLGSTDATAPITIPSSDLAAGQVVTLVGGGGAAPYTLSNNTAGDPAILLKDGAKWTAFAGATINLQVMEADKTYLVEVSRN